MKWWFKSSSESSNKYSIWTNQDPFMWRVTCCFVLNLVCWFKKVILISPQVQRCSTNANKIYKKHTHFLIAMTVSKSNLWTKLNKWWKYQLIIFTTMTWPIEYYFVTNVSWWIWMQLQVSSSGTICVLDCVWLNFNTCNKSYEYIVFRNNK